MVTLNDYDELHIFCFTASILQVHEYYSWQIIVWNVIVGENGAQTNCIEIYFVVMHHIAYKGMAVLLLKICFGNWMLCSLSFMTSIGLTKTSPVIWNRDWRYTDQEKSFFLTNIPKKLFDKNARITIMLFIIVFISHHSTQIQNFVTLNNSDDENPSTGHYYVFQRPLYPVFR